MRQKSEKRFLKLISLMLVLILSGCARTPSPEPAISFRLEWEQLHPIEDRSGQQVILCDTKVNHIFERTYYTPSGRGDIDSVSYLVASCTIKHPFFTSSEFQFPEDTLRGESEFLLWIPTSYASDTMGHLETLDESMFRQLAERADSFILYAEQMSFVDPAYFDPDLLSEVHSYRQETTGASPQEFPPFVYIHPSLSDWRLIPIIGGSLDGDSMTQLLYGCTSDAAYDKDLVPYNLYESAPHSKRYFKHADTVSTVYEALERYVNEETT